MFRVAVVVLSWVVMAGAVTPSMYWRDYYSPLSVGPDHVLVPSGSVVQAIDPDGVECGRFVTHTEGQYGYLHVYGDDPLTPEDEGASPGDAITFLVDGIEYLPYPSVIWHEGDRLQYRADLLHPSVIGDMACRVGYGQALNPIPGALVEVFGAADTLIETGGSGNAIFGPVMPDSYQFVLRSFDISTMDDPLLVSAYDASLVMRHLLTGQGLPAPLEVADVTGDGTVSALDASRMLQFRVGKIDHFTRVRVLWVSQDTINYIHRPDIPAPTVAFRIQRLGDVSGNWNSPAMRVGRSTASIHGRWEGTTYAMHVSSGVPIYSLEGEMSTEDVRMELPDGWIVETRSVPGGMAVAMAGAIPLSPGATPFLSAGPVDFHGWINGDLSVQSVRPAARMALSIVPNPFNPATSIAYSLPNAGRVRVTVHSLTGQLVRVLSDEHRAAGRHMVSWNACDGRGQAVGAGMYFARLSGPDGVIVRRMTLAR
jgi:hypothetical protein